MLRGGTVRDNPFWPTVGIARAKYSSGFRVAGVRMWEPIVERVEQYCYSRKDFKIEWFSGTGPGGQNRNKVQACVRITHLPSGLKATGQNARSRQANLRDAFTRLGQSLAGWIRNEINKNSPQRQTSKETIRTYHFADNRILDHASRFRISADELDRRFDEMIAARRLAVESSLIDGA